MKTDPQLLLHEFAGEAREHLAGVSDDLLALEKAGVQPEHDRLDRLFRAMHSIKGGAALVGSRQIETLGHALETVLGRARQQELALNPPVVEALLAGTDLIQTMLDGIEGSAAVDIRAALDRLQALLAATPPARTFLSTGAPLAARPAEHCYLYTVRISLFAYARRTGRDVLHLFAALEAHGRVLDARLQVEMCDISAGLPQAELPYECLYSSSHAAPELRERLELLSDELLPHEAEVPVTPVAPPPPEYTPASREAEPLPTAPSTSEADRPTSVRINVQILDRLMTLAGELVLVRNQALRAVESHDPQVMRQVVQRLSAITTDVQQAVLLTRMQPVSILFGKFPRLVRDLSKQLGKQIELTLRGTEVELDKAILEALSDPVTHLIRNCCDHGIEPPAERIANGKAPEGHILLQAFHEGGQIRIELRDDGRGIDPQKVRRKAIEKGLKTPAEAAALSDTEAQALILLPGFSTAERVTEVSGRGVGMDVVRTNVEQFGGNLQIASAVGSGTAMHLRLPLTLAIIPCLLVRLDNIRYAIPQKDLEELVFLAPEQAGSKIESTFDQEVYRLRGRLLPLVRLSEVLARRTPFTAATRAELLSKRRTTAAAGNGSAKPTFFAVVKVGQARFGMVVDEPLNTEEIVVKPMHSLLKSLRCFSGSTIMGDGQVALILDVEGIARHAGLTFDALPAAEPLAHEDQAEKQALLLFENGPREQFAVPLAMIRRIEQVDLAAIEPLGDREYLTIKGQSVRIIRLDRYLDVSPAPNQKAMYVLVPKHLTQPVGILLSRIIDTENRAVTLDTRSYRKPLVLGTAIVRDRMTLFLDLYQLGDQLEKEEHAVVAAPVSSGRPRILLVEDTQFFRQLVKGYLEAAGYEVVTAVHGGEALQMLGQHPFDMVVSDIEMPEMDGFRLARAVREQLGRRDLPLLALTTLNSERDRRHARECGFNAYEVKLDRESFLASAKQLLAASGTTARRAVP